ncbi:hypothetical protein CMO88_03565 [Candidatus Woesearchaeota archaeon]|nr:hypothetical protein [Candidatus Woesearchaeota archaeon]|tara:strand:- start:12582 stop:12983 length:402 start_codon:yes stop_codon:yes gene_type:complete
MKLVVDSNRLIAALIKDSSSRAIITNHKHSFLLPEFSLEEINKYKSYICGKAKLDSATFDTLLSSLLLNIEVIAREQYASKLQIAKELLTERDLKDVPFLALALSKETDGIWSDDKDFLIQNKVKIFKTEDLI